jgi:hypothetical protein
MGQRLIKRSRRSLMQKWQESLWKRFQMMKRSPNNSISKRKFINYKYFRELNKNRAQTKPIVTQTKPTVTQPKPQPQPQPQP